MRSSAAAVLVFLTASAGAGVVAADLLRCLAADRLFLITAVTAAGGAGDLRRLSKVVAKGCEI